MPAPKDATFPEFYVYRLEVRGIPFYVGVGRSARASDRVRYVRSLMAREARGTSVKWDLSCEVVAGLLRSGCTVSVAYHVTDLPRDAAAIAEKAEIIRLVGEGAVLANFQYNSRRPKSAGEVVQAVLARISKDSP